MEDKLTEKLTDRERVIYDLGAAGVSVETVEKILIPRAKLEAMKPSLAKACGEAATAGSYEYEKYGPIVEAMQRKAAADARKACEYAHRWPFGWLFRR